MSTFQVDCELEYDVAAQTVFVFNIAVPDDRRQRVVDERVELEPSLPWDELREPDTLNRFIRVDVAPGPFRVRYLAAVDVIPVEADTQAAEVPITALPVDAFACLRGSRYCESEAVFITGYARYAEPPPDFHAVFEAFLGGRWQLFDPTDLSPMRDLVRIGTGRDASEVPFATFFGTARLRRLSALIGAAPEGAGLTRLQTPMSGILLAA